MEMRSHWFIGVESMVARGVKIGERVVIGEGAVVLKYIEPGVVALGAPARPSGEMKTCDLARTENALRRMLAVAQRC